MNQFDLLEMLYNPYPLPEDIEAPETTNGKYILEYCSEYSLESVPNTIYHEWIQLLESDDAIALEICLEPYMRIIERSTGKIITQYPKQIRSKINECI